jgi:hypothetical protein
MTAGMSVEDGDGFIRRELERARYATAAILVPPSFGRARSVED